MTMKAGTQRIVYTAPKKGGVLVPVGRNTGRK